MSTMKVDSIVSSGGTNTAQINGITPALASIAEAQAGTNATKLMTPDTTEEALRALNTVFLGTINTTSGTTQTLSGLDLTPYKQVIAQWYNVSGTSPGAGTVTAGGAAIGQTSVVGNFDLSSGSQTYDLTGSGRTLSGLTHTLTTASTSFSVSISPTNFDAGTFRIYGVR